MEEVRFSFYFISLQLKCLNYIPKKKIFTLTFMVLVILLGEKRSPRTEGYLESHSRACTGSGNESDEKRLRRIKKARRRILETRDPKQKTLAIYSTAFILCITMFLLCLSRRFVLWPGPCGFGYIPTEQ